MNAPTPDAAAPAGSRAAMPFILITVLIDMVSIGLIIPVMPGLIGEFTSNPADQAFWFGAVMFSYGVANFIGSPVLGALSDRWGRRPVLLIGFCGLALSFLVTAMATALWMLLAVRVLSGAMMANTAVANAYVADITPPAERARRFGLLGAMIGLGYILGPVAGGLLGSIDLRLPFFAAGGLALLNWLYGYFVLPESLPLERRQPIEWRKANPVTVLKRLGQLKGVGPLVAVLGLSALAQYVMHNSWVLYTTFKFGWGPRDNGWSLMTMGLAAVLVQGWLLKTLLKRFSPARLAVMGLISSSLCYLGWGLASEGWMMYALIGLNLLGFAVSSSLNSIVSNAADQTHQGQTLGAVASLNSLTAVFAPAIGAALLGPVAHLPAGDWRVGAPFYFCALLQASAMLLALRHFRQQRRRKAQGLDSSSAPETLL